MKFTKRKKEGLTQGHAESDQICRRLREEKYHKGSEGRSFQKNISGILKGKMNVGEDETAKRPHSLG